MDRNFHGRLLRLIGLLLLLLVSVSIIAHYHISNLGTESSATEEHGGQVHRSRSLDHVKEDNLKPSDLRFRIDELKKIKASVTNELRDLENKRQKLHAEMSGYNTHIDHLKSEYEKTHLELEQLKLSIENTKLEQQEVVMRNMPELHAPRRILASLEDDVFLEPPRGKSKHRCRMDTCFDYSRCSLTSQFPMYFYDPEDLPMTPSAMDTFVKFSVTHTLNTSPHMTYDPHIACVYIVLVGDLAQGQAWNTSGLERKLKNLPYWRGDGRNHVIINLARNYQNRDMFDGVDTGRAILVQSVFTEFQFRPKFDLVVPPALGIARGDVWEFIPPLVPAKRKHLLSFQGDYKAIELFQDILKKNEEKPLNSLLNNAGSKQQPEPHLQKNVQYPQNPEQYQGTGSDRKDVNSLRNVNAGVNDEKVGDLTNGRGQRSDMAGQGRLQRNLQSLDGMGHEQQQQLQHQQHQLGDGQQQPSKASSQGGRSQMLIQQERSIVNTLKRMQMLYRDDGFHFDFSCGPSDERIFGVNGEWGLCGPTALRSEVLKQSTFSLIIAPTNDSVLCSALTQMRLFEALQMGAIPVLLGDHIELPFSELISWKDAVVALPKVRITELHFVIRSFSDNDLLAMRRQGRHIWETYMGTSKTIIDTTLLVLRTRLMIPAFPQAEAPSPSVFNSSFVPLREEVDEIAEPEDMLGPIEAPYPSLRFTRNFTVNLKMFNIPGDPFHSYPFTPFENVLPAEAKFEGEPNGMNHFLFQFSFFSLSLVV